MSRRAVERDDELAAEGGNVVHDSSPYKVAIAESRFIHPDGARVDEVVFDAERAGGTAPAQDAGRDGHEPAVADDGDDLSGTVHGLHELKDFGVATHLVGRPAAGYDKRE